MSSAEHEPVESSPGLRERRRLDTHRALAEAALRLFARAGFDDTTVEEIAAEAGVSPRTFFRYFATKDEVLNPDRPARQAHLRREVAEAGPGLDDLGAAIVALVAIADDFLDDRESMVLHRQAARTSAVLRGRVYDVQHSWQETLTAALAERRGVPPDDLGVASAAAAAIGVWQVVMSRWLAEGGAERGDLRAQLTSAFGVLGR